MNNGLKTTTESNSKATPGIRSNKMNVLIINGSPRRTGSTATITNAFSEVASANGAGVRTHNLNGMRNIRGCQSCTKCWEVGHCVVEDDFALCDSQKKRTGNI